MFFRALLVTSGLLAAMTVAMASDSGETAAAAAPSAAAAGPAASAVKANQAAAAASASASASAPLAKTAAAGAEADQDRMVCKTERPMGSLIPKRICKTAAQWDAERESARKMMQDLQQRTGATNSR